MKNIFFFFSLGLLLFSSAGCRHQLDALPAEALVDANAITDQQTANTALNGVYYLFANATSLQTNWLPNQLYGSILGGYLAYGAGPVPEEMNQLANTTFNTEWSRYYALINSANGVIGAVGSLKDGLFTNGRKQQILAEAKFLRAYGHFKLLLWFGQWYDSSSQLGVIIRDQFITSVNVPKARSSVKDCYDFILSDIDYAVDSAAATSNNIYVNKWSAMALKMRILLSRGQGNDYAQCASLGDSILSNSPYVLENNPKDIFYSKGLTSAEVMLGIQPQMNQGSLSRNTSGNFTQGRGIGIYVATDSLKNLLDGDPRQQWIIGPTGPYNKGYSFIKYLTPTLTPSQLSEIAYAFRLSEVYLMEAEALVRSGGDRGQAKTLLKTVLSKAGVTDYSAVDNAAASEDLLEQLYFENVRSLVGEDQQEYFALLRLPLATVTRLRPTITNVQQYILPIPDEEFQHNPLIGDQNPGYAK